MLTLKQSTRRVTLSGKPRTPERWKTGSVIKANNSCGGQANLRITISGGLQITEEGIYELESFMNIDLKQRGTVRQKEGSENKFNFYAINSRQINVFKIRKLHATINHKRVESIKLLTIYQIGDINLTHKTNLILQNTRPVIFFL